jgi:hypothetical protein
MKVALGWKAHTGWAALVVVGGGRDELEVVERRRVELIEPDTPWAKQPYHAAEKLGAVEAAELVSRSIEIARRTALAQMKATCRELAAAGHEVAACAVLAGAPLPPFTVAEILAVHFRMHKAEGVLYRDVLVRAGRACGLRTVEISEKRRPDERLARRLATLGKEIGPPWGKDQKDAAAAAVIALRGD